MSETREQWIRRMQLQFGDCPVTTQDPIEVAEEFALDINDDPLASEVDEIFLETEEVKLAAVTLAFSIGVALVAGAVVFVATATVVGTIAAGGLSGAAAWLFARHEAES